MCPCSGQGGGQGGPQPCVGRRLPSARPGSAPSLARRLRLRPAASAASPRPCRPLTPGRGGFVCVPAPPALPYPPGGGGSDTGCVPPVWLTTQNHSTLVTERSAVPFLPVNPEYSATRNQVRPPPPFPQALHPLPLYPDHPLTPFPFPPSPPQGRQKLARFNAREFATLLIDILGEAKRRQQGKSLLSPTGEG